MIIERKTEREFGIYNSSEDMFHNLDYTGTYSNESKHEETPTKAFTYEECQRFIAHMKDKDILSIHNVYQPKYLLAFQLDVIRKQRKEEAKKEFEQWKNNQDQNLIQSTKKTYDVETNKKAFLHSVNNWDELLNSKDTQTEGKFGEILNQKPKLKDFDLSLNNFSAEERRKLLSQNILE